jgi:DNA-binding transcriptional ArsR family regulator
VDAFAVLAEPVRRRLLELLATGERTAGELCRTVSGEFGISQPAGSQHLKVLREGGLAVTRVEGRHRVYGLDRRGLAAVRAWLLELDQLDSRGAERQASGFDAPLDALATEVARGRRRSRASSDPRAGTQPRAAVS